jgi:hypothetical protein
VGKEGIQALLDTLMRYWNENKRPRNFKIRLFRNYPTFAFLVVDRDYFLYPYGHATLGNFSPVLHFSKGDVASEPVITFLDAQYGSVKSASVDAESALNARRRMFDTEKMFQFGLYFIPPEDSDLYRFGTEVLGYDVRRKRSRDSSPWRDQVGSASEFGFHLTVCDVLFFLTRADLKSVITEAQFLAREIRPFDLTELQVRSAFPDGTSISIAADDPSGNLEVLHHELVQRVNRRAAASNYSLGLAGLARDKDYQRAELMIKRYCAPYILKRFIPHFTLLTNVAAAAQARSYSKVEKLFAEKVEVRAIRVDRLAVMARPSPRLPWIIAEEIELG